MQNARARGNLPSAGDALIESLEPRIAPKGTASDRSQSCVLYRASQRKTTIVCRLENGPGIMSAQDGVPHFGVASKQPYGTELSLKQYVHVEFDVLVSVWEAVEQSPVVLDPKR